MRHNIIIISARRQDAALGQFTAVDPLAEEFYSISPYAYCAGNPIMLIDPTGMYLKGTNKRAVSYNPKTGWSRNASADLKRVGNAMMKTTIGTAILKKMISSSYPISIKIDTKTYIDKFGETDSKGNKKVGIYSAKIIIYNMLIIHRKEIGDHIFKENLTEEDVLGALGVHEGTHATDKESNGTSAKNGSSVEVLPNINELKHINELKIDPR